VDYATLKLVHQGAVTLSVAGFALRGLASLAGAGWVRGRAARTLPHLLDTLLLASGLMLAWLLQLTTTWPSWLVAKLLGLVVYVALGVVALRPHRPRAVRAAAWLGAMATVGWMVSVALTKDPRGLLAPLL
jgi:uncharacterized membrane protein SirB2